MNYLIVSIANSIRISAMYHRSIRACLLTVKYKPIVAQHFTVSSKHKCLCIQVISRSSIPTKSYVYLMHRVISLDVHLLSLTQCYTIAKVPLLLNRLTVKLLWLTYRLLILILYRLLPKSSLLLLSESTVLTESSLLLLLTKSCRLLSESKLLLTKPYLLLTKPSLWLLSEATVLSKTCLWLLSILILSKTTVLTKSCLLTKSSLLLIKTSLVIALLHRDSVLISECLHALIICLWIC